MRSPCCLAAYSNQQVWGYDEGYCYFVGIGHSGAITKSFISPDQVRASIRVALECLHDTEHVLSLLLQETVVTVGEEGGIFLWALPLIEYDFEKVQLVNVLPASSHLRTCSSPHRSSVVLTAEGSQGAQQGEGGQQRCRWYGSNRVCCWNLA